MNSYLMLYLTHRIPVMLVTFGVIAHIVIVWRARSKTTLVLQEKLRRTRVISMPIFALLTLSIPVTGVGLTHMAGWPLSQKWLMVSIIMYPLLFVFGGFLYRSLTGWQAQLNSSQSAGASQQKAALLWVTLLLAVLFTIELLMMMKPL